MLSIETAERSFAGGRDTNEDCAAVTNDGQHCCLVVSDGAGGHAGGALASKLAVNKVLDGFRARPPADPEDLAELLLDAHETVLAAQRAAHGRERAMHATVVVLSVDLRAGTALWGHVGDSRLYVFRHGVLLAVTHDHSVVQWMVDAGYMDEEQARDHPNKNRLLAALGADTELHPTVQARPFKLEAGDAFLLCTDGWWSRLADGAVEATLRVVPNVTAWLDSMAAAIDQNADAEQDNYSAVAAWIARDRRTPLGGTVSKSGFDWESS